MKATTRERVRAYLSHPENRIHICQANALLWDAKEDGWLADKAREELYRWVSIAQENNEQHF